MSKKPTVAEQRRKAADFVAKTKVQGRWKHHVAAEDRGKIMTMQITQKDSLEWTVTIIETDESFTGMPFACMDWVEFKLETFAQDEAFGAP